MFECFVGMKQNCNFTLQPQILTNSGHVMDRQPKTHLLLRYVPFCVPLSVTFNSPNAVVTNNSNAAKVRVSRIQNAG